MLEKFAKTPRLGIFQPFIKFLRNNNFLAKFIEGLTKTSFRSGIHVASIQIVLQERVFSKKPSDTRAFRGVKKGFNEVFLF